MGKVCSSVQRSSDYGYFFLQGSKAKVTKSPRPAKDGSVSPGRQSEGDISPSSRRQQSKKSIWKRKWPLEDLSKVWLIMPPLLMALLAVLVVAAER